MSIGSIVLILNWYTYRTKYLSIILFATPNIETNIFIQICSTCPMTNSFMMNQKPEFKTEFITLPADHVVLPCDSANLADPFGIAVYTKLLAEESERNIRDEGERKDEIVRTPRFPYYLHDALVYVGHDPVTHITMCHRLNLIHDRCPP